MNINDLEKVYDKYYEARNKASDEKENYNELLSDISKFKEIYLHGSKEQLNLIKLTIKMSNLIKFQ